MQAAHALPVHVDDAAPRPVVRGTDIKVSQIAFEYEHHGMTPDEIVEAHPHLTLADVHAALTYFYDHMEAIRADWRETDRIVAGLRRRGVDLVTPGDQNLLGASDEQHVGRATHLGRVVVTSDREFFAIANGPLARGEHDRVDTVAASAP